MSYKYFVTYVGQNNAGLQCSGNFESIRVGPIINIEDIRHIEATIVADLPQLVWAGVTSWCQFDSAREIPPYDKDHAIRCALDYIRDNLYIKKDIVEILERSLS